MDTILTLIVNPDEPSLSSNTIAAVRAALADLGAETTGADWLAPGIACDIGFSGLHADQAMAAARIKLSGAPIDVVAGGAKQRRKKILVADMESTIIEQEMLDEIGAATGQAEAIAAITKAAMNGEMDFAEAFRARIGLLKGVKLALLDELAARITAMPGAATLVATMKAHGGHTALISGGFDLYTARVAEWLGFDEHQGNRLEVQDGLLTGAPIEPVQGRNAKLTALIRIAAAAKLPLSATLAVGDGANDLDMLGAAGVGIAYHPKPIVAAAAPLRLHYADLTGVLYAQGYRREEFVVA